MVSIKNKNNNKKLKIFLLENNQKEKRIWFQVVKNYSKELILFMKTNNKFSNQKSSLILLKKKIMFSKASNLSIVKFNKINKLLLSFKNKINTKKVLDQQSNS
jgi:hypothetical protein